MLSPDTSPTMVHGQGFDIINMKIPIEMSPAYPLPGEALDNSVGSSPRNFHLYQVVSLINLNYS